MAHLPRFFVSPRMLRLGRLTLPPAEAHHACKVLRLQPGDKLEIGDGAGWLGVGHLAATSKTETTVEVETVSYFLAPRPRLNLATAIPKGKRWQWLVEKCTELGAAAIQPLCFDRSVAQGEGNPDKWERWAIEAAKQARRLYVPRFAAAMALADFLAAKPKGLLILASADGEPASAYVSRLQGAEEIVVIIGPEGDLTPAERSACLAASALPLRLSMNILRVETAAATACAVIGALAVLMPEKKPL